MVVSGDGFNIQAATQEVARALSGVAARTFALVGASTLWDFAYATYALIVGGVSDSHPMNAIGTYYLSLAFLSTALAVGMALTKDVQPEPRRQRAQALFALACGILLLGVNGTIAKVVGQLGLGWMNSGVGKARFLVTLVYAMVMVFLAVSGMHQYKRHPSPLVVAAKGLGTCKAVMTVVFLTLSAGYTFGGSDGNPVGFLTRVLARYLGWVAAILTFTIAMWTIGKNVWQLYRLWREGRADADAS